MIKWLIEMIYAFITKSKISTSFWMALRFVRCDYLIQQDLDKLMIDGKRSRRKEGHL